MSCLILMPWKELFDGDIWARKQYNSNNYWSRVEFDWDVRSWDGKIELTDSNSVWKGSRVVCVKQKSAKETMKLVDDELIVLGYRLLNEGDKLLCLL